MNWACTVKEKYFRAIKDGRKMYEVRRRIPHIKGGDILFVCCGSEVLKCEIVLRLRLGVMQAWKLYRHLMFVEESAYYEYLRGKKNVFLVRLRPIEKVTGEELVLFRHAVARNPQWFSKVNF